MKILICGVGALGSQLLSSLTPDLRGKSELTILDFDTIEERNLMGTQLFFPEQEGVKKTEALQYNIYKLFSRKVGIITEKLTEKNIDILKGYDLIIDAFDNYSSRKLVYDYCKENSLDCIHMGFSPNMTFEVCWNESYQVPSDNLKAKDICEMAGASSFIKLASACGANTVLSFINDGIKRNFVGNRFLVREII